MTRNLFVYGTLMASATDALGRVERVRLQGASIRLGAATVRGRLYDLGSYPALVLGDGSDQRVHGEVVEIADPARVFRWLDVYEGIDDEGEYMRVEAPVVVAARGAVTAWMYTCRQVPPDACLLPSGRWIGPSGAGPGGS